MRNDELVEKLQSEKIKVIFYVSLLFMSGVFIDFYFAIYVGEASDPMFTVSPFFMIIFSCIIISIGLVFESFKKILTQINQSKNDESM